MIAAGNIRITITIKESLHDRVKNHYPAPGQVSQLINSLLERHLVAFETGEDESPMPI